MKTDTLKKSLLDYAIKGKLTAKFRRENSELSAFDELEIYNDKIKQKRKNLEKELKTLEFKLKKASTRHCETSAGSRGKTSEAVQGVAEAGFFSNPQTKQELKSQIQMLKKELTKCKEITPLNLSEAPFEIPNSWAWVKLGDICEIRLGKTPPRDTKIYWNSNDYQWVSIADMGESKILAQTKEHISQAGREKCFGDFIFKKGTLLLSFKLTIGKVAFLGFDGFHNEGIASVLPLLHAENEQIFKEFLFHFLPPLTQLCESTGAIKGETLNKQKLNNLSIPLPPLKEQHEIVGKLDLLVTLANDFAITKENLKRIEKRIEKSLLKLALEGSLSKLYRRSSPTLSAFNEISTYNDNIKQKRKDLEKKLKICEKELKLEKDKDKKAFFKSQIQILKKEIAKCKEITPLNLSEAPFEIPSTWAWVKGCDIFLPIDNTEPQGDFFKYIDIDSIDNKNKKVKSPKTIETKNASSRARRPLEYGDVLFSMVRPYLENIALIDETLADCIASTGFFVCRTNILDSRFLYYLMTSPYVVYGLNSFMKGDNSPSIVKDDILNFNYPLPPLCEQEYIVQTLNTLFTLKKGLRVD
ncbi:restriction endonuclease subunit S [Campylobacter upsaliensis]